MNHVKANRTCAKRSTAESKDDDTIEYCITVTASSHHRHSFIALSRNRSNDPNHEGFIDIVYYVAMGYLHVSKGDKSNYFQFSEMLINRVLYVYTSTQSEKSGIRITSKSVKDRGNLNSDISTP